MTIDIEDIVRKMVLLGIPLLPLGCNQFSSCPDSDERKPDVEIVQIPRPEAADGGASTTSAASFQRCAQDGDCAALCQEYYRPRVVHILSCGRLAGDAGMPADNVVAVRAEVITICEGRRPEGYRVPETSPARCQLGAWLAQATHAEALSVPAFERLARELSAHGGPPALVRAARQSAREERRHTRMMATLLRRHDPRPIEIGAAVPRHVRTLEAMALENASEGCVRETMGALVARWQSTWARDAQIRAAMNVIAPDEARHAELAWQVDAWATTRLPPAARKRVARAKTDAFAALEREMHGTAPGPTLLREAGMPSAAASLTLARAARPLLGLAG